MPTAQLQQGVPQAPANPPQSPLLIVDARNCMYRAIYAGKQEAERNRVAKEMGRTYHARRHHFTIMLRMIASWIKQYRPGKVQIFWDAPRVTVWRKQIFDGYKDRDNNNYIADISEDLVTTERVARACFNYLNVWQFRKKRMEADDLIFAACKLQCHRPMVVVSSDADMLQIPYMFPCVKVFNPEKGREVETPRHSPVLMKAITGDKSDRIPGYFKVGPKTAEKLLCDPKGLQTFLEEKGKSTFVKNLLLVDLSVCPYLLHNQLYVTRVLATDPVFDRAKLVELEREFKIAGLMAEYIDIVAPFKNLPNK